MRHFTICALAISTTFALTGCAYGDAGEMPDEAAGTELDESSDELFGKLGPAPTRLTFYENSDFTGASYSVELTATANENVRLIPKTEVEAAGMLSRISAAQLSCGGRAGNVTLFDAWNTGPSLDSWSPYANGATLACAAGQVDTIDLHADAPALADRVASAYFVNHANLAKLGAFSALVRSNWIAGLQDLPDGATAKGDPVIELKGSGMFTLRQNFTLDDLKCGSRGAHFVLTASMDQTSGSFYAWVSSVYVDTGWGDYWGCRTKMKSALSAAAGDAAAQLDTGLDGLAQIVGTHPRYYLFPQTSLRDFDIAGGGGSSEPIIVFY